MVDCDSCGDTIASPAENQQRCDACALGHALASADPPDGGWPRGSDMDRL